MNRPPDPVLGRCVALLQAGRLAEAEAQSRQALMLQPRRADLRHLLGVVLMQAGRLPEAVAELEQAVQAAPRAAALQRDLALALLRSGDRAGAEARAEAALKLDPADRVALRLRGDARLEQGKAELAARDLRKLAQLQSGDAEVWNNLGLAERALGRHAEAEAAFRKALEHNPRMARAATNLGNLLLHRGAYAEGWPLYTARWQTAERQGDRRRFPQPFWTGQDLNGGRLLVWSEQGPGDQILLGTQLPDLLARGIPVLLECKPRMGPVFQRALPGLQVVELSDPPHPACLAADIAAQVPLGDLGRVLRPDAASFPDRPGYLQADPARVQLLRDRYRAGGTDRLVGLSWRSKNQSLGGFKSSRLLDWAPVLTLPGLRFVNLQYGDCAAELAEVDAALGVRVIHDPEVDQMADMEAFLAQTAALDAVVTTSCTTAHVAGGLGKPTCVLLPHGQGTLWYWGPTGETTPWYPTLRLLRQDQPGDWSGPLHKAAAWLD